MAEVNKACGGRATLAAACLMMVLVTGCVSVGPLSVLYTVPAEPGAGDFRA